ncbi:unnamed protein product [Rhizoctonia solani]|uniref:DUF6533 domain-containing protein n=1 Tax=Rhizoctonia solani TaxID=456999 RepID=A0A8H3GMF0_9AGAM|nr:unnamed protein product [Rhizoctonia solani]
MSLLPPGTDIMDLIEDGLAQIELAKRLTVVSLTLLAYDWASNFHLEVAYIWGAPWTYGRFLYHINRLCPFILLCTSLPDVITGVLVLRCWALYSSRRVLWALGIGLVCTATCTIVVASQILKKTIFLPQFLPGILSGCTVIPPSFMWIALIPTTIYESIIFIVTLWKLLTMKKHFGATILSRRLAEHCIVYFAVRVALIIFACIGSTIRTVQIATNASGIVIAVSSVVCSRIIFSLYQLDEERNHRLSIRDLTYDNEVCCGSEFAIPMTSVVSSAPTR